VLKDLGSTNADLERGQQIYERYSQGATNIMNFTYQDNADENISATIPFYMDDDVDKYDAKEITDLRKSDDEAIQIVSHSYSRINIKNIESVNDE